TLNFFAVLEESHGKRVRQKWLPTLKQCEYSLPSPVAQLRRGDVVSFIDLWLRHLENTNVNSQHADNLIQTARKAGLEEYIDGLVYRGNTRDRLYGIAAAGYLQHTSAWETLAHNLTARNTFLSLASAEAMVRIAPEEAMTMVAPYIIFREDWPRSFSANLLAAAGPHAVTQPLLEHLNQAQIPQEQAARVIEMLGFAHYESVKPMLRQILETSHEEPILIAALAVIGEQQDPENVDIITRLAQHPNWPVRVRATNALKTIGTTDQTDLLLQLLCDASWWVRYRAAQALINVYKHDPGSLTSAINAINDPYAKDMMRQVQEEEVYKTTGLTV
ncbi:MAG: HEAT repeat domain-containing protein, partial [Cyanobacteria bacterium HKST-UBA06]|nr:HEAT repeat domain-containing protein [Cyanobacteria bacterium HKST-UBA06]